MPFTVIANWLHGHLIFIQVNLLNTKRKHKVEMKCIFVNTSFTQNLHKIIYRIEDKRNISATCYSRKSFKLKNKQQVKA